MTGYTVGMNTGGSVSSKTLVSLTKMFNSFPDDFQSRLIVVDGGCADLAGSRNRLVRSFLGTGLEWMLVVDTDIVWEPDDWQRLRDSADLAASPFVAGTYFVDNTPSWPCCVIFKDDGTVATPNLHDDSPELLQVSAAGIGFGLIHRDVFLKAGDPTSDHEWFEHGWKAPSGMTIPEDYCFCSRVGSAGIPVYLNTKVRVGHLKSRVIGWDEYQRQQEVQK